MTADVSVVIPTYNGASFIREALESVFAQTLLPKEIIVVDDASTDETQAIVSSMIATSPVPLRLIQLTKNSGGPAHPLNVGIQATKGEFIAILDQDDVFLPRKIQVQAGILAAHPEMAFAFSLCGNYHKPEELWQPPSLIKQLIEAGPNNTGVYDLSKLYLLRLLIEHGNIAAGYPGFIFHRKDWKQTSENDKRIKICGDYKYILSLSYLGAAGFTAEVLYLRRWHKMNLCNHRSQMLLEKYRIQINYLLKEKSLLEDKQLLCGIQNELLAYIYWCRQAHQFINVFKCLFLFSRIWGCNQKVIVEAGKCVRHQVLTLITHCHPIYTYYSKSMNR